MNRRLWLTLGAASLVAGLSANAAAKTQITYMYNWYNEAIVNDAYQSIIADFNRTHPDIEVVGLQGGGYDKLQALMAAGEAPDVVEFERSAVIEWVLKDQLTALPSTLFDNFEGAFLGSAMKEVDWFGKLWGVPWDTDLRGLFWNTDLFAAAGLDGSRAPGSIAELDQDAAKLSKQGSGGGYEQLGFVPWQNNWYPPGWFWAFGGDVYDYQKGQPVVNLPQNVEAYNWLLSYADRYGYDASNKLAGSQGWGGFAAGKVAMIVQESGFIARMRDAKVGGDLHFAAGEVPHVDGATNGTWAGGSANVIPAGAKHVDAALVFLKYLGSPEVQRKWYDLTQRLPTNVAAARKMYAESSGWQHNLLNQMEIAHPRPPMWVYILVDAKAGLLPNRAVVLSKKQSPQAVLDTEQQLALQYPLYQQLHDKLMGK